MPIFTAYSLNFGHNQAHIMLIIKTNQQFLCWVWWPLQHGQEKLLRIIVIQLVPQNSDEFADVNDDDDLDKYQIIIWDFFCWDLFLPPGWWWWWRRRRWWWWWWWWCWWWWWQIWRSDPEREKCQQRALCVSYSISQPLKYTPICTNIALCNMFTICPLLDTIVHSSVFECAPYTITLCNFLTWPCSVHSALCIVNYELCTIWVMYSAVFVLKLIHISVSQKCNTFDIYASGQVRKVI